MCVRRALAINIRVMAVVFFHDNKLMEPKGLFILTFKLTFLGFFEETRKEEREKRG